MATSISQTRLCSKSITARMKVKWSGRSGLLVGEFGWVRVTDELKRRCLGLAGLPRCLPLEGF